MVLLARRPTSTTYCKDFPGLILLSYSKFQESLEKMPQKLKTMLDEAVKVVNFNKAHPLNSCILMSFVKTG
jgi:hypothetical protein